VVNTRFLQSAMIVFRSAGVGLLATATDLVALAVLVSGFHLSPRVASLPALALGIGVQFVGNKLFAFEDRSKAWMRQGMQFLAVESLGFVANLVLYDLAVTHFRLPYLALRLLTTNIVYFAICLPLWSRIFRPAQEEPS
jgi:putative flippase GtrA